MIARVERIVAHAAGWHTPACHGRPACYGGPGSVVVNALGWHRWLSQRGRRRGR